jgi:hypothetical protein
MTVTDLIIFLVIGAIFDDNRPRTTSPAPGLRSRLTPAGFPDAGPGRADRKLSWDGARNPSIRRLVAHRLQSVDSGHSMANTVLPRSPATNFFKAR